MSLPAKLSHRPRVLLSLKALSLLIQVSCLSSIFIERGYSFIRTANKAKDIFFLLQVLNLSEWMGTACALSFSLYHNVIDAQFYVVAAAILKETMEGQRGRINECKQNRGKQVTR